MYRRYPSSSHTPASSQEAFSECVMEDTHDEIDIFQMALNFVSAMVRFRPLSFPSCSRHVNSAWSRSNADHLEPPPHTKGPVQQLIGTIVTAVGERCVDRCRGDSRGLQNCGLGG